VTLLNETVLLIFSFLQTNITVCLDEAKVRDLAEVTAVVSVVLAAVAVWWVRLTLLGKRGYMVQKPTLGVFSSTYSFIIHIFI